MCIYAFILQPSRPPLQGHLPAFQCLLGAYSNRLTVLLHLPASAFKPVLVHVCAQTKERFFQEPGLHRCSVSIWCGSETQSKTEWMKQHSQRQAGSLLFSKASSSRIGGDRGRGRLDSKGGCVVLTFTDSKPRGFSLTLVLPLTIHLMFP